MSEFEIRSQREPGWFWAENEVLDKYGAQLGAHAGWVYMAFCRYANNENGQCRISVGKLSRLLDMSPSGVSNAIVRLVALGLVQKVEDWSHRKPGVYALLKLKVKPVDNLCSSVHPMDTVSTGWTQCPPDGHAIRKERLSNKTKSLKPTCKWERCDGSGWKNSISIPGKKVACECQFESEMAGS